LGGYLGPEKKKTGTAHLWRGKTINQLNEKDERFSTTGAAVRQETSKAVHNLIRSIWV